ncbi:MAG: peptide deformylase [Candidatus Omnitrophica bacterium]|nr:peptide deformylase [Candidatus Omnitrophota bacterium]
MPLLKIRLFPDPILRKPAKAVTQFNKLLEKQIDDLAGAMKHQPSGIGIAAPQAGISLQLAIVDVSSRIPGATRHVLINPEILEIHTPRLSREGCMSLPEYTANLKRYDWIKIRFQDLDRRWIILTASGIEAVCIQHEIDHLQGKLFLDRVASLKTDMFPRTKP